MRFLLSTRPLSAFRLVAALGLLLVGALLFAAEPEPASEVERVVVLISVDSIIHPVAEAFVVEPVACNKPLQLRIGFESVTRNPRFGRRSANCRTDQANRDFQFFLQMSPEIPADGGE